MATKIAIGTSFASELSAAFRPEDEYIKNFLSDRADRRLWLIGSRREPSAPRGELLTLGRSDRGKLNGYFVKPEGKLRGAAIFAHDIFGITEEVMLQCDKLADEGYAAIAPNLYFAQTEDWQAQRNSADVKTSLDLAKNALSQSQISDTMNVIQIAIDTLDLSGNVDIHVLGYDFGGSVAWLAAKSCHGLASAISFYSPHIRPMETFRPKCPALLHLSDRDARSPAEWVRDFTKQRPDVCISTYRASPGFGSDRSATRVESAASRAWKRTIEWLNGGFGQFSKGLGDSDFANQLLSRFFRATLKDWPTGPNGSRVLDEKSSKLLIENWLTTHTDIRAARRNAVSQALHQRWHKEAAHNLSQLSSACERQVFPDLTSTSELDGSTEKIEHWLRQRYSRIEDGDLKILAHRILMDLLRRHIA